jgi:hypothetical protein
LVVEYAHASCRDGAHRQLLVARDAQLAHDKDVQGRAERAGHFICDGHAAARQSEHEHVGVIDVGSELRSEQPPCFAAITKGS